MKRLCSWKLTGWRLHKGLTMQQLADEMTNAGHKITKAAISSFEKGISKPLPETLTRIAQVFDIDPAEMTESGFQLEFIDFHASKTLSSRADRPLRAKILWLAERREELYRRAGVTPPPWTFGSHRVTAVEEADELALQMQQSLKLPPSEQKDFAAPFESGGAQILELQDIPLFKGAAARSSSGVPYLIIQTRAQDLNSQRLVMARQLALLLLAPDSPVDATAFAQRFAGEMVLPTEVVVEEMGKRILSVDFQKLSELQSQYRIPLDIWLQRAHESGVITTTVYRSAKPRLPRMKKRWNQWDPKPTPDRSSIDCRLIAEAVSKGRMSAEEARKWLGDPKQELELARKLNL